MSAQPGRNRRPAGATRTPAAASWLSRHRQDLLLAVVVLLVVAPVMQPLMAQQASRFALTAALWDSRTVVIDDYEHWLGVDRATRDGRLYSDKAPGQPLFAVPAYALYRALGGHPATEARVFADPGLWAASLWSAALPAALLAVLMRRLALRVAPRRATVAALAMALGTMLLPFATQLFSHVLSALCGLGAYLLVSRRGAGPARIAAAGLLAGAGVAVEYTAGVLAVILGAVALARHRERGAWFALGLVPPAALTALYHWVAFGGPLQVGYRYSEFAEHQEGLVGVALPRLDMTLQVLAGERGLFVLTPIVLGGVIGCAAMLLRQRRQARLDAAVALVVFAAFLFVMGGWSNATAGASPGPRYLTPALPFLAGGVAWLWQRHPLLSWAAAAAGTVTMGVATFTLPLVPRTEVALLDWLRRLAEGRLADTVLTQLSGAQWTVLLPLLAAAALAVLLLRAEAGASSGRVS